MDIVTIEVELHEGDLQSIRDGQLDFRRAIELVLNHGHPFTVISVKEGEELPSFFGKTPPCKGLPGPRLADYMTPGDIRYPPQKAPRHMPQTNEDWENLGYDIEARLPASIEGWTVEVQTVRDAVATAIGKREGYPDDAKRWLVQTAGKLGIA